MLIEAKHAESETADVPHTRPRLGIFNFMRRASSVLDTLKMEAKHSQEVMVQVHGVWKCTTPMQLSGLGTNRSP
jgi:hypothetical protein